MFIRTSNEDTAEMLRKEKFTELPKEGKFWVFINDKNVKFSKEEKKEKNIIYTNKMFI